MSSQSRVDPELWKQLEMTRIKKKKACFEVLVYMFSQNRVDLELWKQLEITRIKKKSVLRF